MQTAQSNLASANNTLATAQSDYATAAEPANKLAAEQTLLATMAQQLTQYQTLAGTNTSTASLQAAQLTQQAQTETQYVLPPLQAAAQQAQSIWTGRARNCNRRKRRRQRPRRR